MCPYGHLVCVFVCAGKLPRTPPQRNASVGLLIYGQTGPKRARDRVYPSNNSSRLCRGDVTLETSVIGSSIKNGQMPKDVSAIGPSIRSPRRRIPGGAFAAPAGAFVPRRRIVKARLKARIPPSSRLSDLAQLPRRLRCSRGVPSWAFRRFKHSVLTFPPERPGESIRTARARLVHLRPCSLSRIRWLHGVWLYQWNR